mgnify:FL=1
MAKTEAEILQIFKEHAIAKKLSISEVTMQKTAARVAQLSITDDTIENSVIDSYKDSFNVINDNIRDERSKQKRETEDFYKKQQNPNQQPNPAPIEPQPADIFSNPEIKSLIDFVKGVKQKEVKETKMSTIESLALSKGIPKEKRSFISKSLEKIAIGDDTNEEDVAQYVVGLYNELSAPELNPAVPSRSQGNAVSESDKASVQDALKDFKF